MGERTGKSTKGVIVEPSDQAERRWLTRCASWKLNTPDDVLKAMSQIWRAYCGCRIGEQRYKMLMAGLKEIRAGREAEAARRTLQEMGVPFSGMVLIGPGQQRSDDNSSSTPPPSVR